MFKVFDIPKKEAGEGLNTADRFYLIKLIVATAVFTIVLTLSGVQLLLENHISRLDKSTNTLMEWSKRVDLANEMLNDMFKVQQIKESYESQGIGATEEKINLNKEAKNETKD